ncbi:MAG: FKBP-type peptidyl-prolyl cis-trans isomerase [Phycisphaerales bacterium]|nr:FKBP-type peptidyl-prolyl cis-trans isomerase [Phycisphaerales bacterium]
MPGKTNTSALPLVVGVGILLSIVGASLYFAYRPAAPSPNNGQYPGWAAGGEPVTTPSGLKYYDIEVGTGRRPAGPANQVRVHYTGYLVDGTKFDASADHGGPQTFGLSGVVPGFAEGILSMNVGGKRKIIIPPSLGYGPQAQGRIPPNSTLVFDIELLAVLD